MDSALLRDTIRNISPANGTLAPGTSRAWPFYNPDLTTWIEPARFEVRR